MNWWFPGVMEGLRWENCALLITVQKAAPLMLVSYLIEIDAFTLRIILLSTIVGSIGELNQILIRKILTYSPINHTGWILIALTTSENLWLVYFTILDRSFVCINKKDHWWNPIGYEDVRVFLKVCNWPNPSRFKFHTNTYILTKFAYTSKVYISGLATGCSGK